MNQIVKKANHKPPSNHYDYGNVAIKVRIEQLSRKNSYLFFCNNSYFFCIRSWKIESSSFLVATRIKCCMRYSNLYCILHFSQRKKKDNDEDFTGCNNFPPFGPYVFRLKLWKNEMRLRTIFAKLWHFFARLDFSTRPLILKRNCNDFPLRKVLC